MAHDDALEFIARHHHGVLATRRRDAGLQMAPVLATVDAEGGVVISTTEPSAKVRNLRREPYATLLSLADGFFGEWHTVEGPVAIVNLPDAMEPLVDYYRSVSGEHPDWDDYRRAMERERRVLLRLTVERSGPSG